MMDLLVIDLPKRLQRLADAEKWRDEVCADFAGRISDSTPDPEYTQADAARFAAWGEVRRARAAVLEAMRPALLARRMPTTAAFPAIDVARERVRLAEAACHSNRTEAEGFAAQHTLDIAHSEFATVCRNYAAAVKARERHGTLQKRGGTQYRMIDGRRVPIIES